MTHLLSTRFRGFLFVILCVLFTGERGLAQDKPVEMVDQIKAAEAASDKAFIKKMKKFYTSAKRIRIDGNPSDWSRLPRFKDKRGDMKNPGQDLIEVSLLPMEKYVDIYIATRGKPLQQNYAFNVRLDVAGDQRPDVMVSIKNNQLIARYWDPESREFQKSDIHPLKNSGYRSGRVLEIRVMYRDLGVGLNQTLRKDLMSADRKPVIRGEFLCWDGESYSEYGPPVAAYRLTSKPYDYYGPLPHDHATHYAIEMPMKGRWYLGQGPHTDITHQDTWAYDFWIENEEGRSSDPFPSKKVSDHYAYGKEIIAPASGKVTFSEDGHEDQPLRNLNDKAKGNNVLLKTDDGLEIYMTHLLKGTVKHKKGDQVQLGEVMGKIGNSGYSMGPHLHLAAYAGGRKSKDTQPLALKNVRVSLNNVDNDPWAREEEFWRIREGFYVEAIK